MISIFLCLVSSYCSSYDNHDFSWQKELTSDVIQKYQAPNDIVRFLEKTSPTIKDVTLMMMDPADQTKDFYLKKDLSRIVGHKRLKDFFATSVDDNFDVPRKYLIPEVDNNGSFSIEKSYVVSMWVKGDPVKFWNYQEIELLLGIAEATSVVDFYFDNIKRDANGKNWLIDTQIKCNNRRRYHAATQIMLNINRKIYQYHLDESTQKYLKNIINLEDKQ